MLAPIFVLDSHEAWSPVPVDESLGLYGYEWDKGWKRNGKEVSRIDFPLMLPDVFFDLPVSGYHRVAVGGGLHWHQYWTWWPYNPKKYAGYGEHEGDWEMVQFGCQDPGGDHPILASYSQHDGGEKREFWRVQLDADKKPLVYVARDSHASYFEVHKDVTDQADGKGDHLDLNWLEFGSWDKWSGQWGNSANSPGPLATRRVWKAPHAWHSQARG